MNEKGTSRVVRDYPMKHVTSFQIGGAVDYFIEPDSVDALKRAILRLNEEDIPWMVMGKGTNMVVSDKGIRGAVIRLEKQFEAVSVDGTRVTAEGGASLRKVAEIAQQHGLSGLEFAHGIPGAVGGAMTMNAGAYGGEMKDIVSSVRVMKRDGTIADIDGDEMEFEYRNSRVYTEKLVVLSATFALEEGDGEEIRARMDDLWARRLSKQPLEYPSAGSTFKRPEGYFAGQLIDQAGLRGLRHGDAQVSEKHCGFVINRGNATCKEVVELIRTVQEAVYAKHGVELETEVKVLGEQ
ncbi:MAG: UDP-N-acetylmuramate dehydrogenase [Peptoniphilus sp.]|nr:UDP-N-acetylmuramate dehydrogenase [Peptoniphilus sp.]MDD7363258.1 UDP-N-acetylmuramate dehydrogenase [Bacillota bacterium]MDY6045351.1 UDP-N-acetylmuramate dehydrogenase [Peptoniphilus sp.]